MNSVTDQDLAAGIAAGSSPALEELLAVYYRPIFRYLWQAGGSKEEAEDLASQTFLRVRREIKGYRAEGSFKAWIFKVAYRELLRFRRRQVLVRAWSPPQPSSQVEPEDSVVLAQALGRIPSDQRSALLLVEVEGLSVDEAATVLGVPAGTVKSRCHYAKQHLRKLLASTFGETHAEPALD